MHNNATIKYVIYIQIWKHITTVWSKSSMWQSYCNSMWQSKLEMIT